MRRFLERVAVAVAGAAAATAAATWSGDGRHVVVGLDSMIALVDARSGAVTRAFPREVAYPLPRDPAGLKVHGPLMEGDKVIVSADGGRLLHEAGGVNVWNVATGRLELRIPGASASALLGPRGEHVAVSRPLEGYAREFSVWDVAKGAPVFSHVARLPELRVGALRTGSDRYAAFSIEQRELWTWSHERGQLTRVALPRNFFVNLPLRFGPGPDTVAITGTSIRHRDPDRQIALFDLRDGRLVGRFPPVEGNTPITLGWSSGGRGLVAAVPNGADFLLYDAQGGQLLHRWRYVPTLGFKRAVQGIFEPRRPGRLVGGVAAKADAAVMSPAGDRLALIDPAWKNVVAWDVTVDPPRRTADLCEASDCGSEPVSLHFSPDGRQQVVFSRTEPKGFWVVDVASGARRRVAIDPAAVLRAAEAVESSSAKRDHPVAARCDSGSRGACLAEGRAALARGDRDAAEARFTAACLIREDADCIAGLREASRGRAGVAARRAGDPAVAPPRLCDDLPYVRLTGVRHFEGGKFAGIRIDHIVGNDPGQWPFEPGDVLANTVGCDPDGCGVQSFMQQLFWLCRAPAESLLRDLRLEVRSAVPERNKDLVLRRAVHR